MGPTWDPSGADRTQVGPMLAPWTSLSGDLHLLWYAISNIEYHWTNATTSSPSTHSSLEVLKQHRVKWCFISYIIPMQESRLFCRCNNLQRRGGHLLVSYPLEISYFAALKANSPKNSTGITHGQKVNASSEPNLQLLTHCTLGAVVVILEGWFFQSNWWPRGRDFSDLELHLKHLWG